MLQPDSSIAWEICASAPKPFAGISTFVVGQLSPGWAPRKQNSTVSGDVMWALQSRLPASRPVSSAHENHSTMKIRRARSLQVEVFSYCDAE
jgi:hypothetical protein